MITSLKCVRSYQYSASAAKWGGGGAELLQVGGSRGVFVFVCSLDITLTGLKMKRSAAPV